MSKVFKGVGKVFRKAAPVLVPLGIAAVTGGLGAGFFTAGSIGSIGAAGASSGLGLGGSLALRAGTSIFSSMLNDQGAAAPDADFRALNVGTPTDVSGGGLISGSARSGSSHTRSAMDWIRENPELTKLAGGLITGAAKGYSEGKDREQRERFNERSRRWQGAFYGTGGFS